MRRNLQHLIVFQVIANTKKDPILNQVKTAAQAVAQMKKKGITQSSANQVTTMNSQIVQMMKQIEKLLIHIQEAPDEKLLLLEAMNHMMGVSNVVRETKWKVNEELRAVEEGKKEIETAFELIAMAKTDRESLKTSLQTATDIWNEAYFKINMVMKIIYAMENATKKARKAAEETYQVVDFKSQVWKQFYQAIQQSDEANDVCIHADLMQTIQHPTIHQNHAKKIVKVAIEAETKAQTEIKQLADSMAQANSLFYTNMTMIASDMMQIQLASHQVIQLTIESGQAIKKVTQLLKNTVNEILKRSA